MARKVELQIVIGRDGKVQVEVNGIKGPGCLEVKDEFARFLGRILAEEKTGEYFEVEETARRGLFGRRRPRES